jgi:lanosterol synthase
MVSTRSNGSINGAANGTDHFGAVREPKKRVGSVRRDATSRTPRVAEKTDRSRWRLLDESGRLTWHYLEDDDSARKWPQSVADKWYLGLDTVSIAKQLFLQPTKHNTKRSP